MVTLSIGDAWVKAKLIQYENSIGRILNDYDREQTIILIEKAYEAGFEDGYNEGDKND